MGQRAAVRYKIQVPTNIIITLNNGVTRTYEGKTRDVSSCGAFLLIDNLQLKKGTYVKLNIQLNNLSGTCSKVYLGGKVVRSENKGIGVSFKDQYSLN